MLAPLKSPLRILVIEDDKISYLRIERFLKLSKQPVFSIEWAATYKEADERLGEYLESYDIVLADYWLDTGTGVDLIQKYSSHSVRQPFIMLTGEESFEMDAEALQAGASDYLVKETITAGSLIRSIRYSVYQKQTEAKLQRQYDFQRLISRISTNLINISTSTLNVAIQSALASIGKFFSLEKCTIWLLSDEADRAETVFSWTEPNGALKAQTLESENEKGTNEGREKPGVSSLEELFAAEIIRVNSSWMQTLRKQEKICISDFAQIASKNSPERKLWQQSGLTSLMLIPMVYGGSLAGILGFSMFSERFQFPDEEMNFFNMAAELLSHSLERKKVEDALQKSQERYSLLIEAANDGIWDWDLSENTLYYSFRWKQTLGFQSWEIGETIDEFYGRVHPDDLPELKKEIDKHIAQLSWFVFCEYRIRNKEGKYLWAMSRGKGVFDKSGKCIRLVGSMTDITARKEAEQKLKLREEEQRFRIRQMEKELDMARQIQLQLLPESLPENEACRLAEVYRPTEFVGGDFFDFAETDGKLVILLCDVSGHGVPAALIASMIKMSFTEITHPLTAPADILKKLDLSLAGKTATHFSTALCVTFSPETRELAFASGGHPPAFLLRRGNIEKLQARGTLLGPFPGRHFEEKHIQLEKGDRLFLYTDGITECEREEAGKTYMFGEERLEKQFLAGSKDDAAVFLEDLIAKLVDFSGTGKFQDDITALVLDIL